MTRESDFQYDLLSSMSHNTERWYVGGTEFFDRMDALVSSDYFFDVQYQRFLQAAEPGDRIVVSGKWGRGFLDWYEHYIGESPFILHVPGGLRHNPLSPIGDSWGWSSYIFLDNSCYKGRTRDKIAGRLAEINSNLRTSLVIYDGSVEPLDDMKGIYRYHG